MHYIDLRWLRRKVVPKLSQAEVSEKLGVAQNTVSEWENGYISIRLEVKQFIELCHLYSCTMEELAIAQEMSLQNKKPRRSRPRIKPNSKAKKLKATKKKE